MANEVPAVKAQAANKTATQTAAKTKPLTKETLTKMVEDKKGLRAMSAETGATINEVRKALIEFNLKTASMERAGVSGGRPTTIQQTKIVCAIRKGAGTTAKVAEKTGMDIAVVKKVVGKLRREGALENAFKLVDEEPTVAPAE